MSLQESLKKFKQQQAKCHSILTDTISRPSSSKPLANPHRAAPLSTAVTLVPPVRFSNDTERLQHINAIRKSPAGAQIKRVIDLLLQTRQALTPEQINEACYVDVIANKTVFDSLKNNHKVNYDGHCFSYKSKHNLKNKSELLDFVRKFPEGIAVVDLKDAYTTVMEDIQDTDCRIRIGHFNSESAGGDPILRGYWPGSKESDQNQPGSGQNQPDRAGFWPESAGLV